MIWDIKLPKLEPEPRVKNFPIDRGKDYVNVDAFVLTNKKFLEQINDNTRRVLILDSVLDYYKISEHDMLKKSRKREFLEPRHHYTYLLKKETSFSLAKIGGYINRDHATVLNSDKVWNNLLETDVRFRKRSLDVDKIYGDRIANIISGKEDPRQSDEEVIANWKNIKHKYYLIEYSYKLKDIS